MIELDFTKKRIKEFFEKFGINKTVNITPRNRDGECLFACISKNKAILKSRSRARDGFTEEEFNF